MRKLTAKFAAASALSCAAGLLAAPSAAAADKVPALQQSQQSAPQVLNDRERQFYQMVMAAIRSQRWDEAKSLLSTAQNGPLDDFLRAELLLAANSPRAEIYDIMPILGRSPHLPQAQRLATLAARRGATDVPMLPNANKLTWAGSAPRRISAESAKSDPVSASLAITVPDRIKNDDPAGAEALYQAVAHQLTPDARDEWRQKIAWSYYIENDDPNALRLAHEAAGGRSAWSTQAAWVKALAAWRLKDYRTAALAFDQVARQGRDSEIRAAGHYWGARTAIALGDPASVQTRLRSAAANEETFYGLLATEALAITPARQQETFRPDRQAWRALNDLPNIRAAAAMAELNEDKYADDLIRHQARIGRAEDHRQLLAMASALNLPETQLYLAHNTPGGRPLASSARYPQPNWQPAGGWKVDPSLVYAHTLQESRFQRAAVSPAGAQGLMQVRPGTARDIARWQSIGVNVNDLKSPSVNMELGQSYLQHLSRDPSTSGHLPKIIAAYNAGPAPIARWQSEIRDQGDPLLYMESIPYWETRGYVAIVLRNYWMYEAQQAQKSESREALARGDWPRFPDHRGNTRLSDASSRR
jgi:soluble lytic murein transglycosylase